MKMYPWNIHKNSHTKQKRAWSKREMDTVYTCTHHSVMFKHTSSREGNRACDKRILLILEKNTEADKQTRETRGGGQRGERVLEREMGGGSERE